MIQSSSTPLPLLSLRRLRSRIVCPSNGVRVSVPFTPSLASSHSPLLSSLPFNTAAVAVTSFALISGALATVSFNTSTSSATCEGKTSSPRLANALATYTTPQQEKTPENPLWPQGATDKDVDELVQGFLSDPSINMPSVPDYIERQIYRSTVMLTLNAIYATLGKLHCYPMLGHEVRLKRSFVPKSAHVKDLFLRELRDDVQETLLEEIADRLMANKAINQKLIPDVIERQLYCNCLKIIFRLLDMLTASFRLTVCGHDLQLQMAPSAKYAIQDAAISRVSSSLTKIDMEVMKEIARRAGVDISETDNDRWFWQRLFNRCDKEFVAQLHASLYSLVLGILDDLLANTELELLSDRICFDIVPGVSTLPPKVKDVTNLKRASRDTPAAAEKSLSNALQRSLPVVTFSFGVGVGLMLMGLFGRA